MTTKQTCQGSGQLPMLISQAAGHRKLERGICRTCNSHVTISPLGVMKTHTKDIDVKKDAALKKAPKKPILKKDHGKLNQEVQPQVDFEVHPMNNNHRASLQLFREDPWGWAYELDKKGLPIAKMISDLLANGMVEPKSLGTWQFIGEDDETYGGQITGYKITAAGQKFMKDGK